MLRRLLVVLQSPTTNDKNLNSEIETRTNRLPLSFSLMSYQ